MELYAYPTSPYGRKVLIVLHELGFEKAFRIAGSTTAANPLGKSPVLLADDGLVLMDSPVICAYLNGLADGELIPASGSRKWTQLSLEALADGCMDAALLRMTRRGDAGTEGGERSRLMRALDRLEEDCRGWSDQFMIGQIAVAALLSYLDLRFPTDGWRTGRPSLAGWYGKARERPSVQRST